MRRNFLPMKPVLTALLTNGADHEIRIGNYRSGRSVRRSTGQRGGGWRWGRSGPVGAGVTVGADHRDRDRERTTIIKEREPRDTTVIKEREREPDRKVIIDHDRD